LFIDERGNHHMTAKATDGNRRLTIVGAIIGQERYKTLFVPEFRSLKRKFFSDDLDTPVVFHWEDVVQRRGMFSVLKDAKIRNQFNRDIVSFYSTQEYRLVAAVIDKVEHRERYGSKAQHPYHYCVEVILERYCRFLRAVNGVGDVYAESRGRNREDPLLQAEFARFSRDGTYYVSSGLINALIINKEIQFRAKQENVYGLQLPDMLAHCCELDVLRTFGHQIEFSSALVRHVSQAISTKYRRDREGNPRGWGQILLSAKKSATPKVNPTGRATTPEGAVRG